MDVNVTTDVKGYGVPAAPAVELEDAQKPPVTPVPESGTGSDVKLDDQALHGKSKKEQDRKQISQEEIEEAVEEIQGRLEKMGSSFKFGLYEHLETESIVGQIRDKNTNEVVKQFPSEAILELRKKLKDLVGLLFDKKV